MSLLKFKGCYFNEETGSTTAIYTYKGQVFEGTAQCHEEDMDMCSPKLGMEYAEIRGYLQFLKFRIKELKARVDTLNGVQRNMVTSEDFDLHSSYSKKLQSSICQARTEINACKGEYETIEAHLKENIKEREKLYRKIRANRAKANKSAE